MYHAIEQDVYSEHGVVANPALPVDLSFKQGRVISTPLPAPLDFTVSFSPSATLPHLLGDRIPLASEQLIVALRQAGATNFQLFPALLRTADGSARWTGFQAFNVLGLLDAADMEASRYHTLAAAEGDMPGLYDFDELVLSREATHEQRMFRLVQRPSLLLVHDEVLEVLMKHRPAGGWGLSVTEVEVR